MFKRYAWGFTNLKDKASKIIIDIHGSIDNRDFNDKEVIVILKEDFKEGAEIVKIEEIKNIFTGAGFL